MYNSHVNGLYTNYSCVTLKKYEFNLTLKKAVLKKGIYIKKKSGAYFTEKKMDAIRARNKIEAI